MFAEALDIVLGAWMTARRGMRASTIHFRPIQTLPRPQRPASEVLLYGVGGTTPVEETIRRGLPLALSQPFGPVHRDCRVVPKICCPRLRTRLLGKRKWIGCSTGRSSWSTHWWPPTAREARDISKEPYEWHSSRLAALRTPVPAMADWERHYYQDPPGPAVIEDEDWVARNIELAALHRPGRDGGPYCGSA